MKQIEIYTAGGSVLITPELLPDSCHYSRVQEIETVTLAFETPAHTEIPLGAYVEWRGQRYTLLNPSDLTMRHSERYEYRVTFYGAGERLKLYKLTDSDGRTKFTLTAKPKEHLDLLVRCLGAKDAGKGWTAGTAPGGDEITVAYNSVSVLEALQTLATALKTEWAIIGTTIHVGKIVQGENNPLALSYGEGKGFRPDIRRTAEDGSYPVGRVYVEGSTRNIDPAKYGAKALHLPKATTKGDYKTSPEGDYVGYVPKAGENAYAYSEEMLDGTDIYPMKEGTVTAVTTTKEGFTDFTDTANTIDFSALLIPGGEPLTVVFQSGMLAGRNEFRATYIHAEKRFELESREEDGITIPGGAFVPKPGDRYAVFGMALPQEYITAAEERLLDRAVSYLEEHRQTKVTIQGEIDPIWAEKNWSTVAPRLALGGFVSFSDPEWQPEPVLIRITGIKTLLTNEYAPVIELSNAVTSQTFTSLLRTVDAQEVYREVSEKRAVSTATANSYEKAKALTEAIEANLGDRFDEAIRPLAIHTMQVLVGDPALQFVFVASPETTKAVPLAISVDRKLGTVTIPRSYLQHRTIDLKDPGVSKTDRPASDYRTWTINPLSYTPKEPRQRYLYAQVPKVGTTGEFVVSDTALTLESREGFYTLWVGVLTADGGFSTMHGFAELTPSQLTIGRMQSPDGQSWIDWAKGALHFQASPDSFLDINTLGDGKVRIKGGLMTVGDSDTTIEDAIQAQKDAVEAEEQARQKADQAETKAREALDRDRPAVWSIEVYDTEHPLSPPLLEDKLEGYRTSVTYAYRVLRSGVDVTEVIAKSPAPLVRWARRNPKGYDDDGLADREWEAAHATDTTVTLTTRHIHFECAVTATADSVSLEEYYKSL